MPLYLYNGGILKTPGGALAGSSGCCCDCDCPPICSYGVSVDVVDRVGTVSALLDPAGQPCDTGCEGSDFQTFTDDLGNGYQNDLFAAANWFGVGTSGILAQGFCNAEHIIGQNSQYFRSSGLSGVTIECLAGQWRLDAAYVATITNRAGDFVFGRGFSLEQDTFINLSASIAFGPTCSSALSSVTIEFAPDKITIGEDQYDWTEDSVSQTCRELDADFNYQDCADYLPLVGPTVTVTIFRRAECP